MSVLNEAPAECSVEFLTEAESEEMLDRIAQAKMGITITEFRHRSARGEYSGINWDSVPGLVDVATLVGLDH